MKAITLTYPSIISLLAFASCAQEELTRSDYCGEQEMIIFHTSLPSLTLTREADVDPAPDFSDGIHLAVFTLENSNGSDSDGSLVGEDGKLNEYFVNGNLEVINNVFSTPECRWPRNQGEKEGRLEFYAFYPPVSKLGAGVEDKPEVVNNSKVENNLTTTDYRLEHFRIAQDISRQVDFVTAHTTGSKTENLFSGVNLEFQHQLSRVVIHAFGPNDIYDVEIAGVRIDCTVMEGNFNLSTASERLTDEDNTIGNWELEDSPEKDYVEYVFGEDDEPVSISNSTHNTLQTAAPIMGKAGSFMLIPYQHEAWQPNGEDATTNPDPKNEKKGMYFSVLVRVIDKSTGRIFYPYPDEKAPIDETRTKIYLSVEKTTESIETTTGKVKRRLYRNTDNEYFTTPDFADGSEYTIPSSEEVREYGWSAVPIEVDWKAGYEYNYYLDFSQGIGLHNSEDPTPGKPIKGRLSVTSPTTLVKWVDESIPVKITIE